MENSSQNVRGYADIFYSVVRYNSVYDKSTTNQSNEVCEKKTVKIRLVMKGNIHVQCTLIVATEFCLKLCLHRTKGPFTLHADMCLSARSMNDLSARYE